MPEINEDNKRAKRKPSLCCCGFCKKNNSHAEMLQEQDECYTTGSGKIITAGVPYSGDLPKDLKPGKAIFISGKIWDNCTRFAVDLLSKKDSRTDIGFHLNPRLLQRYVVRNCRLNNIWGVEETTSVRQFPFQRNQHFRLVLFMAEAEFLVCVDGRHLCGFAYRIPLTKLDSMEVCGNVDVDSVEVKELSKYPDTGAVEFPLPEVQFGEYDSVPEFEDIDLPGNVLLPKGFQQGWQLEIYGRVKVLPHSFFVNLQQGSQLWPHPTILLHLNPRFSTSVGQNTFVRNVWMGGKWLGEERAPTFPFVPGAEFSMAVRRHPKAYTLWVDGILMGEFPIRGNPDVLDTVYVQGDIVLHAVFLRDNFNDDYHLLRDQQLHRN